MIRVDCIQSDKLNSDSSECSDIDCPTCRIKTPYPCVIADVGINKCKYLYYKIDNGRHHNKPKISLLATNSIYKPNSFTNAQINEHNMIIINQDDMYNIIMSSNHELVIEFKNNIDTIVDDIITKKYDILPDLLKKNKYNKTFSANEVRIIFLQWLLVLFASIILVLLYIIV